MHDPEDRSFIGHPRGLGYIAFAEAWERFSYYGMQALLVLYMVNRLLHPGHIEHIAVFGPISPPNRDLSRSALSPGARLDHLRSLHRSRLSYTDCRRLHCRPLSWSNPHDHNRCTP